MIKTIDTAKAPAAIGPYAQAMAAGNYIFTSGQIAVDPATGDLVENDIEKQAEQVMLNLANVLEAAGANLTDAVKTTCYLADMADFAAFNSVYAKYFTQKPARSCVSVKALPKGALCEVEVVAYKE